MTSGEAIAVWLVVGIAANILTDVTDKEPPIYSAWRVCWAIIFWPIHLIEWLWKRRIARMSVARRWRLLGWVLATLAVLRIFYIV